MTAYFINSKSSANVFLKEETMSIYVYSNQNFLGGGIHTNILTNPTKQIYENNHPQAMLDPYKVKLGLESMANIANYRKINKSLPIGYSNLKKPHHRMHVDEWNLSHFLGFAIAFSFSSFTLER